ncbi:toll-interacting protein A-like [Paramacrobiotus metropolitanus]|uniref:toll-interacting protein A-like n=1 Tax=Paramacrobiotus metropolitanus TaxID=2943436 RepID=UPI0024465247|nr:toll-interacting protein A-like [Paramacrobiotus metropolitanus]
MMDSDNERPFNRRDRVMLQIPDDFLRIPTPAGQSDDQRPRSQSQNAAQPQVVRTANPRANAVQQGKLSVTIAQAKLGKNYGLTRMDPYARIRIGHYVFETETDANGATNPRWDKTFQCYVPQGINSVYVEVFDERTFGMDERIAWGHFTIPQRVFEGDALDDWFPLSGKQGDQKEGMVEIVFSYEIVQTVPSYTIPGGVVMMPRQAPYGALPMAPRVPYTVPTAVAQQQAAMMPIQITDNDVKQVKEMFPNIDEDVIRSILEEKNGHKQAAINALLSMTET